jgi:hypothetical protein
LTISNQEHQVIKNISTLATLLALNIAAADAVEFTALTQQCEEALALSALPASLRHRANVYVWRGNDYEQTISSDGGFHCLLQRNHPDSIIPECVTSTGKDSILQGIMVQTKLTAGGLAANDVTETFKSMVQEGEIASPTEPGVNYMMSAYNYIYVPRRDEIVHIGPHTMFFAPNASNEIVGGSFEMAQETPGFPVVAEAGTHSYIITFAARSGETSDVEQACEGQIELATGFASAD